MKTRLRKTFISSVMFTTIFALSGIAAVNPASAAASAGDLIKMDGLDTVYYLGADGKRYVFPNAQTYFSWYSDFSSVVTVPQSELESYRLGANVTFRAGTKLIKITTDPTVYAVEPGGELRSIVSEENAIALYGADWAKRVVDVPDAFFTNYAVKADLTPGKYPVGTLVKSGDATYYYDGTDYRMVSSDAAMAANRFEASNVVATSMSVAAGGASISGAEAELIDTSASGAVLGITPGAGSGLSVALSSMTPSSTTLIADETGADGAQALVPVATVNFTAASDGDVQVNTLKFRRGGIPSSDNDFSDLYLYDGNTLLASYSSISSGVLTFVNSNGLFTVPAGTTRAVTLRVNLVAGLTASRAFNFSMLNASDIVTNGASVSGSFPITSNTMSSAVVSDLGKLTVAFSSNSTTPSPGDEAYTLAKFTTAVSDQDVQIEKLKLTIIGTVDSSDIANFKLEASGSQIGSSVATMASDKTITFDLSANPYLITKGSTKTISLKGDVMNGTSRTYDVYLYNKEDIVARDMEYGINITPNQSDSWTRISSTVSTIQSGSLTISKDVSSPSGNIAAGATDVEVAKFNVEATGEDIKVDTVYVQSSGSLYQAKLYVDGGQVGQSADLATSTAGIFNMGNSFIIAAGQTKTMIVKADIKDSVSPYPNKTAGISFVVSLDTGGTKSMDYTLQSSGSTGTAGVVTANTLTARTGVVTVTKSSSLVDASSSNPSGTINAVQQKIASFVVRAGSGEAVEVTQITLEDDNTDDELGDNFQNLKLMSGSTQIGNTISTLNTSDGTYDFSVSPMITIAAGGEQTFDVFADIKSSPATTASLITSLEVGSVSATGVDTSSDASVSSLDLDLQEVYIATAGSITVAVDSDSPTADQLLMGGNDVEIAKFKISEVTKSENVNITELVVSDSVSSAATGTLMNIELYDGTTKIAGPVSLDTTNATSTYAHAVFSGLDVIVEAGKNKVLTVKADINADPNGVSGSTHTFAVLADNGISGTNSITARGASSGADASPSLTVDVTANEMTVYRTRPTVTWASDTPQGDNQLVATDDEVVAKFNVTNSANEGSHDTIVNNINFGISSTGVGALGSARTLTIYKDSVSASNIVATTDFPSGGSFGDTAMTMLSSPVTIGATTSTGVTQLFIVTLDTSDASADGDKISINIEQGDIEWSDGVTATSSTVIDLPLQGKTITN